MIALDALWSHPIGLRGSDFLDLLSKRGILRVVEARALDQAVSLRLERLLKEKALTEGEDRTRVGLKPPPRNNQTQKAPAINGRGCFLAV